MADNTIHSGNEYVDSFIDDFANAFNATKLKSPKLFVLNYLIKKSGAIQSIRACDLELEKFQFQSPGKRTVHVRKFREAAEILKEKLHEIQCESAPIEVTIASEKEPSLESIKEGLVYKGNNDSSYTDVPSTYVLSNY